MVNGFVVVDKPVGLSSHDVVGRIRRLYNTKKVGHTGTLDPFATGVLPVAIGEATKSIQFLDERVKVYRAELLLGVTTDSYDYTGAVVRYVDSPAISFADLKAVLKNFTGQIDQIPPMYSAIKQDGTPLYRLARKGIEVERQARSITIERLELEAYQDNRAQLKVTCSRGTYVRSLAHDIGQALGCGACLSGLRRLASGPFTIEQAVPLEALAEYAAAGTLEEVVIPLEKGLEHLTTIELSPEYAVRVASGVLPHRCAAELTSGQYLLTVNGLAVAVAEADGAGAGRIMRGFNQESTG